MSCTWIAMHKIFYRLKIWYLIFVITWTFIFKTTIFHWHFYTRQYWFVLKAFVTKLIHELNFWHIYNLLLGTQKIPLHLVKLFTYFTTNDLLFNNNEKICHDLFVTYTVWLLWFNSIDLSDNFQITTINKMIITIILRPDNDSFHYNYSY